MKRETKDTILAAAKKIKLDKTIKRVWDAFKMRVYEKVELNTYSLSEKLFATYLFGRKIRGTHMGAPGRLPSEVSQERRVFYLKINREESYTMMCIQHWVNIIHELDGRLYFVCDKPRLERKIIRECRFWDADVEFLRSMRKELRGVAKTLYTGIWEKATYAHLTPFYHAKAHGYTRHWDIDGDDTMFFLNAPRAAEALRQAEALAEKDGIKAFSLDMHRNTSYGRHWSFGVAYINGNDELCRHMEGNRDLHWKAEYDQYAVDMNLDWFFNYLRNVKHINVQTFYVENCYYLHWGCDLARNLFTGLYYWHEGKLTLPIVEVWTGDKYFAERPIRDCYQIDINATLAESQKFYLDEVHPAIWDGGKKMYGIEELVQARKYGLW